MVDLFDKLVATQIFFLEFAIFGVLTLKNWSDFLKNCMFFVW